jgi:hypothetical protein
VPSRRRTKLVSRASAALLCLLPGSAVAGGPLWLDANGDFFLWSTTAPVSYRTDGGPLSRNISESAARNRVLGMFNVWQNVASSSIRYARAGLINPVPRFSDGDVSTAVEFDAVEGDCFDGNQSPIVYDEDGSLFEDLGADSAVIGFAGPCAADGNGHIVSGRAVLNGIFQDGVDSGSNFELTATEFDAVFVHEFGHFSGLDHSQINLDCLFTACGTAGLAGLPTMFPFLLHASMISLSPDDIGWISKLYPASGATGFAATHGTIQGVVYFEDGRSHVQFVNVIARRVDIGGNEDRRMAASVVSGYRFRILHGNSITNSMTSDSGSENPTHIGLYEIPVPAGNYTVEVESIFSDFVGGSRVGPGLVIEMPGTAPRPIGPITVAAGTTVSGKDVVLKNTPPRFDQFEAP